MSSTLWKDRRYFIGGSDARIIMGDDEAALIRGPKHLRSTRATLQKRSCSMPFVSTSPPQPVSAMSCSPN
jgi:hypothetical protein